MLKDNLIIFIQNFSDKLKEIGIKNLPQEYQEVAESKILTDEELTLGKWGTI